MTARAPRRAPLGEYARKRDFAVTPEPAPSGEARPRTGEAGRPTFMIHKHHASHLHYDLRLEMDGALASWAVPKGPSYDPGTKRLAVQTEDHPLEYGAFEGRIPEGQYGAGESLIWDRGTYEAVPPGTPSQQRRKGHLHVVLHGEKLKGAWHLVRTGRPAAKPQWLLFKGKDEEARPDFDVLAERPESVKSGQRATAGPARARARRRGVRSPEQLLERVFPPMLATLSAEPPEDEPRWLYEVKYDGFRGLAALSGGEVALWSRNSQDLSARFPGVVAALARIAVGEAVLDGEIVVLDGKGASRFQLLQGGGGEARMFLFDLLWLDGEDLRGRPLDQRRELLERLLAAPPAGVALSERLPGAAAEALARARGQGFEGVIAKERDAPYEARRSLSWRKLKVRGGQELAIVGYTDSTASLTQVGALLLGVMEQGQMRFAGKVGTGFSQADRLRLRRELKKDLIKAPPVAPAPPRRSSDHWVRPRLVAQVQFTEWTHDGKLRHPTFQGLRPDKSPGECVREPVLAATEGGEGPSKQETASKRGMASKRGTASQRGTAPREARAVILTHPERIYYPKAKLTKQDVAAYYALVSGPLLAALADRPLALEHWPQGVGRASWFEQGVSTTDAPWLTTAETPTSTGSVKVRHLIADRAEALTWLAQHGVLTIHAWTSRLPHLAMPDWLVFDLDPGEGASFAQTLPVARSLRTLLEELSLPSLPKTSGKRGLHIIVPLLPVHSHEDARRFAIALGKLLEEAHPEVTLARGKAQRKGRLYLDCMQNAFGKTIVAPYSLRGVEGAPVSTPLRWDELGPRLDPGRFTLRTLGRRLDKVGDLFGAAIAGRGVRLPELETRRAPATSALLRKAP